MDGSPPYCGLVPSKNCCCPELIHRQRHQLTVNIPVTHSVMSDSAFLHLLNWFIISLRSGVMPKRMEHFWVWFLPYSNVREFLVSTDFIHLGSSVCSISLIRIRCYAELSQSTTQQIQSQVPIQSRSQLGAGTAVLMFSEVNKKKVTLLNSFPLTP